MAKLNLPIHPTKRHPLTGLPLRAIWVRPDGRACWPIMGGAEADDAAAAEAAATKAAADKAAADKAAEEAAKNDTGFPANTPVEQMTAPQREAYHKNQTQKWQGRAENSYGLLQKLGAKTPEEIDAILEKVNKHDALEQELMSDKDKAVAQAKEETKTEVRNELMNELVKAKFEAANAGRLEDAKLAAILEPLDLKKFLTSDGKVDTAKVKTYVDGVAPAKGTQRTGPTPSGQGSRPGSDTGGTAQERAKARLERLGVKTPE